MSQIQIWVDADACPVVIKEMLFRVAKRTEITTTLVANQFLRTPASPFIKTVQVMSGFDVADNHIVEACSAGDLVITSDIPLAALVVEKGATALNPRGELYTVENIRDRLSMRDLMETLRSSGIEVSQQAPFNHADKQAFAGALDRYIAQHFRKEN